jgi:hypothetical protein
MKLRLNELWLLASYTQLTSEAANCGFRVVLTDDNRTSISTDY